MSRYVERFGGWWLEPQPSMPERLNLNSYAVEFETLEKLGIGLDEPVRVAAWIVSRLPECKDAIVSRMFLAHDQRVVNAVVHSRHFPATPDMQCVDFEVLRTDSDPVATVHPFGIVTPRYPRIGLRVRPSQPPVKKPAMGSYCGMIFMRKNPLYLDERSDMEE